MLIPLEDLGPNGDLIDWLRVGAKGDPATFRSILERALATSPTPWALQIQRLPSDLPPWDLEDHDGVRDLLCELGHQGPLSRDAHLRLLAERCGVALATLQEATREIAQAREPSHRDYFGALRFGGGTQSRLVVGGDVDWGAAPPGCVKRKHLPLLSSGFTRTRIHAGVATTSSPRGNAGCGARIRREGISTLITSVPTVTSRSGARTLPPHRSLLRALRCKECAHSAVFHL